MNNLQRSNKLHSTNAAKKFGSRLNNTLITGLHTNLEIQVGNLDILALGESIHFTHELGQLGAQGLLPAQNLLEENENLVGCQTLQIRCLRLKGRFRQALPLLGESVDNIYQGGIELRLRRQTRGVEPSIPVQLVEKFRCFRVRLEEVKNCGLELV